MAGPPRNQRTLAGVSPGPPSSSEGPGRSDVRGARRSGRTWGMTAATGRGLPRAYASCPIPSTNPRSSTRAAAAELAAPSPGAGARKNSAKPPSASRSRRTMPESYVSSALATRSTSGRGKPSA
jgi:hypothetical protein